MERLGTLYAISKPPIVRFLFLFWFLFTGYDTVSGQLEWPIVRKLWGVSGSLLPWWGWLLILQAIFVYALFEYMRKVSNQADLPLIFDDSEVRSELTDRKSVV